MNYSETHWASVQVNEDGTFGGALAGEYESHGGTVTEKIERASYPDMVGLVTTLKCSIAADTSTCIATLPHGQVQEEKWTRVK